jgi:hypothetical protein
MKKYSDFILENNTNEGILKNIFGRIGSFLKGSKKSILDKISKMKSAEKEFIEKSDELSYDIFSAESGKEQNSSGSRQKALISKRALEALRLAKNGEINFLAKEVKEICGEDISLINFYNQQKTLADTEIAQYAYEKARRFKDSDYEKDFYNQWKTLDSEVQKIKFDDVEDEEDAVSNLGMFDLPLKEFVSQIQSLPKSDIAQLLSDANDLKWTIADDYRKKSMTIREVKNKAYRSGDIQTFNFSREKFEEMKNIYRKANVSIDNKMSMLKNRLKNI